MTVLFMYGLREDGGAREV